LAIPEPAYRSDVRFFAQLKPQKFNNIHFRLIKPNGVSVNCNVAKLACLLLTYQLSDHIANAFTAFDVD
jgi:hypothetical protein